MNRKFTHDKYFSIDAPFYLYAGGSVLAAYYNVNYDTTEHKSDVDLFVYGDPSQVVLVGNTHEVNSHVDNILDAYKEMNKDIYHVIKYRALGDYPNVDVVFLQGRDIHSTQEFHDWLVDRFDITICATAWDGKKFYIPKGVDMKKMTSPSTVKEYSSKYGQRRKKYIDRGFLIID